MTSTHIGKLILRVTFSVLIIWLHGFPKIQNLMTDEPQFPSIFGMGVVISLILAIIAETVFPFLVIIGYKTRLATIPIIITMLVAAFVYHAQDPMSVKEKPLLFLFGFIAVAFLGAGKYSIDKK